MRGLILAACAALVLLMVGPAAAIKLTRCERRCAEREYKPLCAGLFLTRRHWNGKERRLLFTEAFPNKCAYDCARRESDYDEEWKILNSRIRLDRKCEREFDRKGYFSGKCLDCPSKDKPQRPDHDHWRPPFWRPPVGASCATVSPSSRCDCCLYKDKPLRDAWCRDEFRDACVLRGAVDTTAATVVLGSAVDIPLPPIDPDEQP